MELSNEAAERTTEKWKQWVNYCGEEKIDSIKYHQLKVSKQAFYRNMSIQGPDSNELNFQFLKEGHSC